MFFKKKKRKNIGIEGMHCENCVNKIDKALEELSDVERVSVSLKKKRAVVFYDGDVDSLLLQKTIEDLGFSVTGIKELY